MPIPRSQLFGLIAFTLFNAFALERAIFFLFFIGEGHSALDVSGLQVLLFVTIFLAEIPTGIFGDVYGKKTSLMVGCALKAASLVLQYTFAASLPGLAVAIMLYGVALSFISGSFSALLFECLKRSSSEGRFARLAASMEFLDSLALAGAMALGPFVQSIGDWKAVYLLTALTTGIAALALLPVPEPAPPGRSDGEPRFNLGAWRGSVTGILYLVVPMALIHACMTPVFINIQLVCTELGAGMKMIGGSIGAVELVSVFLVFTLMKKAVPMSRANLVLISAAVATLCALNLFGHLWLSIGLFFLMNSVVTLAHISQSDAVHRVIADDHVRASTMSFITFCDTIAISGGYLLFGVASRWLSYTASLSLLAVFPVVALMAATFMRRPAEARVHA